jgi:hypothetical protein
MPDRPGALGQVASRIGAVGADVIGIEILERGAGKAIDELVIDVDDAVVDLLVAEVLQVDGVAVEDIRRTVPHEDDALTAAAHLSETSSAHEVVSVLCEEAANALRAEWAVVLRRSETVAATGDHPAPGWIAAFVEGVRHAGAAGADTPDLAWAAIGDLGLDVVLGREGRPLRDRERHQLALLARIAAARLADLGVDAR